MKIIVDKMPEKPEDCLLSTWNFSCYTCEYGTICDVKECNILRPITDFCAKVILDNLQKTDLYIVCIHSYHGKKINYGLCI